MKMTGIIVPLYIYPGPAWQTLISTKQAFPSVPIVAVINPSSGPGPKADPNYTSGITALKSAEIKVLGYVPTGYGKTLLATVESMISSYIEQYPGLLDGIFFDEMASSGGEAYYSSLNYFAKSRGLTLTCGNPGTATPASYVGIFDILIEYENAGMPAQSCLAFIAYGVSNLADTFDYATADWLYVTSLGLPNPYDALPAYLAELAGMLA